MSKHVEMIVDYIMPDGSEDFMYNDNHGVLTRCKDCKFWKDKECQVWSLHGSVFTSPDDFCSYAKKEE